MRKRHLALGVVALSAVGCGGTSAPGIAVPRVGATTGALINAGAGAVLYVAAGGCKIAGCSPGHVCNPRTERCEELPCSAGCPDGSSCEPSTNRCLPNPQ